MKTDPSQTSHPMSTAAVVHHVSPAALSLQNAVPVVCLSGLVLILAVAFLLLRRQMQHLVSQVRSGDKTATSLASELEAQALLVRQMSMDLEELRKRLSPQVEGPPTVNPLWTGSDAPVNLNRRGQIIRLSRKGKSVAEIAQDLNVAQGEVELLLKVHDLSQPRSG